jgi:hypothetical protein
MHLSLVTKPPAYNHHHELHPQADINSLSSIVYHHHDSHGSQNFFGTAPFNVSQTDGMQRDEYTSPTLQSRFFLNSGNLCQAPGYFILSAAGSVHLLQQSLVPSVTTTMPVLPSCTTSSLNCLTMGNTFLEGNNAAGSSSCLLDSKYATFSGPMRVVVRYEFACTGLW